jgi:ESF2/ABP1 family protein
MLKSKTKSKPTSEAAPVSSNVASDPRFALTNLFQDSTIKSKFQLEHSKLTQNIKQNQKISDDENEQSENENESEAQDDQDDDDEEDDNVGVDDDDENENNDNDNENSDEQPQPVSDDEQQNSQSENEQNENENEPDDNVDDEQDDENDNEHDADTKSNSKSKSIVKPMSASKLAAFNEKQSRTGVIYLSRIPPFMKVNKIRHIFEQFGEIGRIFLTPEDSSAARRRAKSGGNRGKKFVDGW